MTDLMLPIIATSRQPYPDDGFNEFWSAYPRERRVAKRTAYAAYRRALKRTTAGNIIAGAQRYEIERRGQDHRFTKHPTTWLNGDCWDDAPAVSSRGTFMDILGEIDGTGHPAGT